MKNPKIGDRVRIKSPDILIDGKKAVVMDGLYGKDLSLVRVLDSGRDFVINKHDMTKLVKTNKTKYDWAHYSFWVLAVATLIAVALNGCASSQPGAINFRSRTNECVAECRHTYGLELDWIGGATGTCYCK